MAGEGNNSGGNVNDMKKQVMEAQAKAKKSQAEALDDINKFTEKVKEDLSKCLDKITANIDTAYNVDYTRTCWWELWADAAFINSSVLGLSDPDYKMIIDLAKKLAKAAGKGILNLLEVAAEEHKSEMNPYILISRAIINMSTLTGIAFGFYIKTIMSIIMVMTKIFVEFATAKTRLKLLVRKCGSGNSWCEKKIKKGFENLKQAKEEIPKHLNDFLKKNSDNLLEMETITVNEALSGEVDMTVLIDEMENLSDSLNDMSEKTSTARDNLSVASALIPTIVSEMSGMLPSIDFMISAHYHFTTRDVITSYQAIESGMIDAHDRYAKILSNCMAEMGKESAEKTILLRAMGSEISPADLAELYGGDFGSTENKEKQTEILDQYYNAQFNMFKSKGLTDEKAAEYAANNRDDFSKAMKFSAEVEKANFSKKMETEAKGKGEGFGFSSRKVKTTPTQTIESSSQEAPASNTTDYNAISNSIQESKTPEISDEERKEFDKRVENAKIKYNTLSEKSSISLFNLPQVSIKALMMDKLRAVIEAFQGLEFWKPFQGFMIMDDFMKRILASIYKSYHSLTVLMNDYYDSSKSLYKTFYEKTDATYIIKLIAKSFDPNNTIIAFNPADWSSLDGVVENVGEIAGAVNEVIQYVGDIISQVFELVTEIPSEIQKIMRDFILAIPKVIKAYIKQLMQLVMNLITYPFLMAQINTTDSNLTQTGSKSENSPLNKKDNESWDNNSGMTVQKESPISHLIDNNQDILNKSPMEAAVYKYGGKAHDSIDYIGNQAADIAIELATSPWSQYAEAIDKVLLKLVKDKIKLGDDKDTKSLKEDLKAVLNDEYYDMYG